MKRHPGRALVVCALLTACGTPEPEAAPAPPPPKSQEIVGAKVADLHVDHWLQGEAQVGGTQLLVFWELWCPHCRREVPELQALHEALAPKGLQVVGLTRLTRDVPEADVLAFVAQQGVTYPLAVETGELARQLKVQGIPAAAVVVDGEVVWRGHPGRLTREQLESWL